MWFRVVNNLAADSLLGTSFIDKYTREIFPTERKLMPWQLQPVDVIFPSTKTANAATIANHIYSQPFFAPLADDIQHWVVVAKEDKLAAQAHTLVMMKSISSGRIVIEPTDESANGASLHVARKMADVILNDFFPILLTNMSIKLLHLPKCMIVAHVTDSLDTEAALL